MIDVNLIDFFIC